MQSRAGAWPSRDVAIHLGAPGSHQAAKGVQGGRGDNDTMSDAQHEASCTGRGWGTWDGRGQQGAEGRQGSVADTLTTGPHQQCQLPREGKGQLPARGDSAVLAGTTVAPSG